MTATALLVTALLVGTGPGVAEPAAQLVLAEMAPAPGRWEAEDAPAYFSDRKAISDARASGAPVARSDQAPPPGPREDAPLVVRRP